MKQPKSESNKMQISIRQIDLSRFGPTPYKDTIEIIVQEINKAQNNDSKFELQKMAKDYPGFEICIYHTMKLNPPRWLGFFKHVVADGETLLNSYNNISTFLVFIAFKNSIYAISGGAGNIVLDRYSVSDLGTQVLTRLIKKDDKVINTLKDRSFIGNVLGQSRIYKDDQRLTDEDQFGKIYNAVKAVLNKEILTKVFQFPKADLTRRTANCIAHSSFQINKRISFDKLLQIIERIEWLFETKPEPNFTLNDVIHIDNRRPLNKTLRDNLELEFKSQLYDKYMKREELDFDFCHKKYEDYYSADDFIATRGRDFTITTSNRFTFASILAEVEKEGYLVADSLNEFILSFLDIRVETRDSFGDSLTVGSLFQHLNGEVIYEGSTYFYLGAEWYRVKSEFIDQLNNDCIESLKQLLAKDIITEPFTCRTEDEYVSKFFGKPKMFALHKVLYENIELCDLIFHDDNTVYLIHIKKGFNHSVRELASQISMAARRLIYDRKSNCKLISKLETKLLSFKGHKNIYLDKVGNQKMPAEGLASIFNKIVNDNQIIFCLAFVDNADVKRDILDNIKDYDSSIAKYSVLELKKALMSYRFGFKVIQLNKEIEK